MCRPGPGDSSERPRAALSAGTRPGPVGEAVRQIASRDQNEAPQAGICWYSSEGYLLRSIRSVGLLVCWVRWSVTPWHCRHAY